MTESHVKLTVGVFGHYGNRNLGDESIIAAVIENLRRRVPNIRFYGLSVNPADTRERHGIESFAIRKLDDKNKTPPVGTQTTDRESTSGAANCQRLTSVDQIKFFLKRIPVLGNLLRGIRMLAQVVPVVFRELVFLRSSFKIMRGIDLLLVAGSNQFLDNYGGAFAFPYTLLKWTVLAKVAGKKVAFVSVGAGPLDRRLSKMFVKSAIRLSDYCSVRDSGSQKLIQSLGGLCEIYVYPDLAYSLKVHRACGAEKRMVAPRGNIGINPMPIFYHRYWYTSDASKYRVYTEKLAVIARDLIKRQYSVTFFPTQKMDDLVIEDIVAIINDFYGTECREHIIAARSQNLPSLLELIENTDFVIATRFHGTVLSLLMERPVLGICYQDKTFEVMDCYGLAEYAVHLETFQPDDLIDKFAALAQNKDKIAEILKATNVQQETALSEQYDRVLALCIDDRSRASDD